MVKVDKLHMPLVHLQGLVRQVNDTLGNPVDAHLAAAVFEVLFRSLSCCEQGPVCLKESFVMWLGTVH